MCPSAWCIDEVTPEDLFAAGRWGSSAAVDVSSVWVDRWRAADLFSSYPLVQGFTFFSNEGNSLLPSLMGVRSYCDSPGRPPLCFPRFRY